MKAKVPQPLGKVLVQVEGLDLGNERYGAFRLAQGHLISRQVGGKTILSKPKRVRFLVPQDATEGLLSKLLQDEQPNLEIDADDIKAIGIDSL